VWLAVVPRRNIRLYSRQRPFMHPLATRFPEHDPVSKGEMRSQINLICAAA
jgi:hypothetical protein